MISLHAEPGIRRRDQRAPSLICRQRWCARVKLSLRGNIFERTGAPGPDLRAAFFDLGEQATIRVALTSRRGDGQGRPFRGRPVTSFPRGRKSRQRDSLWPAIGLRRGRAIRGAAGTARREDCCPGAASTGRLKRRPPLPARATSAQAKLLLVRCEGYAEFAQKSLHFTSVAISIWPHHNRFSVVSHFNFSGREELTVDVE